ncbi:hypothetical protein HZH66_002019 [Vespula vulgaris]|uniref:Uncharacterized protein n=1 Tax=Vespula vulgaris TaxID=7454 RepID=A0A834KJ46_VESVU|nr:hypothetical protein HZH66_002019 [Vespula vulgaris]
MYRSHHVEIAAYRDSQIKDDFILLCDHYYLKIKAISKQNLNSKMIVNPREFGSEKAKIADSIKLIQTYLTNSSTIQFRKLQSLVRDSATYVRAQDSILPHPGIFKRVSWTYPHEYVENVKTKALT